MQIQNVRELLDGETPNPAHPSSSGPVHSSSHDLLFCLFVPTHILFFLSVNDDTHPALISTSRLFFILISRRWDTKGPVAICDALFHESR